jgi:peptidoglycan hydrolase CwlO-like protein
VQTTINQRIKFLLEHYGLSARDFGRAIGAADNTTQNYLGPRETRPHADYIEKVLRHFESLDAKWFLTGEGQPFPTESSMSNEAPATNQKQSQNQKKNRGNITNNIGPTTYSIDDCKKECEQLRAANHAFERLIDQLHNNIRDKDKLITILESQLSRP